MTDRDDARRMLAAAAADLKALGNMLDEERFEDSIFGFHAQQTAEKALKAWLSLRGRAYPKTQGPAGGQVHDGLWGPHSAARSRRSEPGWAATVTAFGRGRPPLGAWGSERRSG